MSYEIVSLCFVALAVSKLISTVIESLHRGIRFIVGLMFSVCKCMFVSSSGACIVRCFDGIPFCLACMPFLAFIVSCCFGVFCSKLRTDFGPAFI